MTRLQRNKIMKKHETVIFQYTKKRAYRTTLQTFKNYIRIKDLCKSRYPLNFKNKAGKCLYDGSILEIAILDDVAKGITVQMPEDYQFPPAEKCQMHW